MGSWILLSTAERWQRIASITALLAIVFCAIRFFKIWFLVAIEVMFTPNVLISLGAMSWIFLIGLAIHKLRNR